MDLILYLCDMKLVEVSISKKLGKEFEEGCYLNGYGDLAKGVKVPRFVNEFFLRGIDDEVYNIRTSVIDCFEDEIVFTPYPTL